MVRTFILIGLATGGHKLVPKLIRSGVRDPHSTTLHIVWNSSNQKARITKSTSRVNSGSRTRYDRTREGLKGSGGSAAGVAILMAESLIDETS